MNLVLVDNGEYTAVYHDFYKNKLAVYRTADGLEGLMEVLGVRVVKTIDCPDPKQGRLVDSTDGFPYHLDNLPASKTEKKVARKTPDKSEKVTKEKPDGSAVKKAGRKARRPPKRKPK